MQSTSRGTRYTLNCSDAILFAHHSMDCSDYPALDNGLNQTHEVPVDLTIDRETESIMPICSILGTADFQVTNLMLLELSFRFYPFSIWVRLTGAMSRHKPMAPAGADHPVDWTLSTE